MPVHTIDFPPLASRLAPCLLPRRLHPCILPLSTTTSTMMRIAVVFALLALTTVADPYRHDSHYSCPKGWTLKGDGKDAVCYRKTTTHAKVGH